MPKITVVTNVELVDNQLVCTTKEIEYVEPFRFVHIADGVKIDYPKGFNQGLDFFPMGT